MKLGQLSLSTPWQQDWRPEVVGTLVFVVRPSGVESQIKSPTTGKDTDEAHGSNKEQVLLIHKKTGHGAGKINAPGGKLEPGESVVQCACREVQEEVGLQVFAPQCRAELRFVERNGDQWLGFAFLVREFSGVAAETSEAKPFWCNVEEIPFARMWPDDQLWLPSMLAGAPFQVGNFLFDDGRLLDHSFVNEASVWDTIQSDERLW